MNEAQGKKALFEKARKDSHYTGIQEEEPQMRNLAIFSFFASMILLSSGALAANVGVGNLTTSSNFTLADGSAGNWSLGDGQTINVSVWLDWPVANPVAGMYTRAYIYRGQTLTNVSLNRTGLNTSAPADGYIWNNTFSSTVDYNDSLGNITVTVFNAGGTVNNSVTLLNYKVDAISPQIRYTQPTSDTTYQGSVGVQQFCANVTDNTAVDDSTTYMNFTSVPAASAVVDIQAVATGTQANSTERQFCVNIVPDVGGIYVYHFSGQDNITNRVEGSDITLTYQIGGGGGGGGSVSNTVSVPAPAPPVMIPTVQVPTFTNTGEQIQMNDIGTKIRDFFQNLFRMPSTSVSVPQVNADDIASKIRGFFENLFRR